MQLHYTLHARSRLQQRSIPPAIVDWLVQFGHPMRHDGADVYSFDRKGRKRLKQFLGTVAFKRVQDLLDVYAVLSDDGQLVTVAHRTKRLRHH